MDEQLDFRIPIHPGDLQNVDGSYGVENAINVDSLSEKQLSKIVDELSGTLRTTPLEIIEHKYFDNLFSLLNSFSSLSTSVTEQIFSLLKYGLDQLVTLTTDLFKRGVNDNDEYYVHKTSIKMYTFFIHWFLNSSKKSPNQGSSTTTTKSGSAAKGRGRGKRTTKKDSDSGNSWDTETTRENLLSSMIHILELDLSRLWKMTYPEDEFTNLFATFGYSMLENSVYAKSKPIKRCLGILFSLLVKKYNQSTGVVNSFVNLMHHQEHLPSIIVDILEVMVKEYNVQNIISEILREIGRMNPKEARDSSGVKNMSVFISDLGDKLPKQVLPFISLLLPHLAGESYMMRNGIVQMIGYLIVKGFDVEKSQENSKKSNDEEDEDDENNNKETKEELINILEERFRDVNSYTRGRCIHTWQYIIQCRGTITNETMLIILSNTIGRLQDKAAQVRKSAIQLLSTLLQYNPFGPQLNITDWKNKLQQYKKSIELKNDKKQTSDEQKNEEEEEDKENEDEEESSKKNKNKYTKQEKKNIEHLEKGIKYIKLIEEAVPTICQLLGSKNASDITETINFFVSATNFQVESANIGIRKMLMLIWSKESSIKESVIDAYYNLYVNPDENTNNKEPARVAKNLINLTVKATLGELTSLEELLTEMMKKQYIDQSVIQILWEIFAMRYGKNSKNSTIYSRGALILLSMLATADPEIIRSKLTLLIQVGLGPRWKEDEYLARYTCIALQKLAKKTNKENKENEKDKMQSHRLKSNHPIFIKLSEIINDKTVTITKWYSAAEQAISTIYILNETPDACVGTIIKQYSANLFPSLSGNDIQVEEKVEENSYIVTDLTQCPVSILSKFLFIIGQVALKQLTHIEEIQSELRKRQSDNSVTQTKNKKEKKKEAIEEELGVVQAVEENEREVLQDRAEKDVVSTKNLIGVFGPVIALICANSGGKFSDHTLRTSAVLALCKLMCVSSDFCEKHLQLLFTILKTAPEASIRSNIVIALGDLAFRFPNLIEPWTPSIYGILRDVDHHVRKNTLMVLSHLILNDMIKVKGQISEMAFCIEDSNTRISDLARLFFHELSQKSNTIYNILPDLISSLSNSPDVTIDTFKNIMKYLFSFIEKEKQTESLVEKLCHRFRTAKEQEWKNIAYCLSLLNYNDKAIKKLSEYSKLYQDKLQDEEVIQSFTTILSKTRKFAKQEVKDALTELENKINAITNNPDNEEEDENGEETGEITMKKTSNSSTSSSGSTRGTTSTRGRGRGGRKATTATKTRGKTTKRGGSTTARRSKKYESDDEEEEEDNSSSSSSAAESDDGSSSSSSDEEPKKKNNKKKVNVVKKGKANVKGKGKKIVESDSDSEEEAKKVDSSDDDSDNYESEPEPKKKNASPKKKVESSSENSDNESDDE